MQDDSNGSEFESDFSEEASGGSESEFTCSTSSLSSSSEDENDESTVNDPTSASHEEGEPENVLHMGAVSSSSPPKKRARTRGGFRAKGLRTRGGCTSVQLPSTSSNSTTTDPQPTKRTTKAYQKKKKKNYSKLLGKMSQIKYQSFHVLSRLV